MGWGCLDKSLSQNEVEMEHALVMMWNLMFAFCPAGKRGFGLVIFFFFPVFFSFFLSLAWMPAGEQKDAAAKTRAGVKNMNCESISCQGVPERRRSEQTQ